MFSHFKSVKALFLASSKSSAFRIVPLIPRGYEVGPGTTTMATWSASSLLTHSAAAVPLSTARRTFSQAGSCLFSVFQFQAFASALLAPLPVLLIILPSAFSPSLGVEIPSSSLLVLVFLISFHF